VWGRRVALYDYPYDYMHFRPSLSFLILPAMREVYSSPTLRDGLVEIPLFWSNCNGYSTYNNLTPR